MTIVPNHGGELPRIWKKWNNIKTLRYSTGVNAGNPMTGAEADMASIEKVL